MFITFEGIEGAGKGTAIKSLRHWLEQSGKDVFVTLEPGGSELGKQLRAFLLDSRQKIEPEAELFLYLADRAQHVRQVITPALEAGRIVISDRYADSTIVYQGYGRGLEVSRLYELNKMAVAACWPDVTFLLDLPPEVGLERARARNTALGLEISEGRFEAESLAFHTRIRNGYLQWAKENPKRFYILDASKPPEDVFGDIREVLNLLNL